MLNPTFQSPMSLSAPAIWVNPHSLFDRVTIVRDNTLVVANPDRAIAEQLRTQLVNAQVADLPIGQPSAVIPLPAITRVTSRERSELITVHYVADGKARFTTISLADQATRDAVLHQLQARLGAQFTLRRIVQSSLRASLVPAVASLLIALFTFACYQGALQMAAGDMPRIRGRAQLLKTMVAGVVSLLGPTGVLIVGGLCLVGCLIWLIKRASGSRVFLQLDRAAQ